MSRRDIGTDDPRVRVRPARSKPRRSKKTLDYSSAPLGMVYAVDRGRYHVRYRNCDLVCVKARELGRYGIVVGDNVRLQGDLSGKKDTLARIVAVEQRRSVLRRSTEDSAGAKEKPMVANANQLGIVTACADPVPRPGMIDRCLVAAYSAQMSPLLILTKSDLVSPQPIIDLFAPLNIPYLVTSALDRSGFDQLEAELADKTTVLVGHSGVGKSTIMNFLLPQAARPTGIVNQVTGRGRHTSTSVFAMAYRQGWLIDTPGIRSFGLAHLSASDLLAAFPDISEIAAGCAKNCTHLPKETSCALNLPKADQLVSQQRRISSFQRLLLSQQAQQRGMQ